MSLSPKQIQLLVDIKKEMLSREAPSAPEPQPPKKKETHTPKMRHARVKSRAFQRYCQRGRW